VAEVVAHVVAAEGQHGHGVAPQLSDFADRGRFDASLAQGTLAVVSGRLAKKSPDAMTVHTPSAILGVRGTHFVVSAGDGR
jgi:hypothetical protein